MNMYIRAGDLKPEDVIPIDGKDCSITEVEKYKKQGRKWVTVVMADPMGSGYDTIERAFPADVMVPWKGASLF